MKFEKIKSNLNERLARLESHLNKVECTLSEVGAGNDMMILVGGSNINENTIDKIYNEVRLINLALDQMMEGSYGICKSCGKAIHYNQLERFPYSGQCANCHNR